MGKIHYEAVNRPRQTSDGRVYFKFYSAVDINGNRVLKVFYTDGTTEIIKGSRAYEFPMVADKYYKSLSGLRQSKWGQNDGAYRGNFVCLKDKRFRL